MPEHEVSAWSSHACPAGQRYDAWAHVLSDYFLPWKVTSRPQPALTAAVRLRQLQDCRYLSCTSDPISGRRGAGEISRTRGDYFNLLYVVSGMEVLQFEGREVVLSPGHFILWDTERRMQFTVTQRLEKLTLIVPERQLRALLPNAQDYVGVPVDGRRGMGRLLSDHLRALKREIWNMRDSDVAQVRSPTLELLARTYASVPCRRRPNVREATFQRIRDYILERLPEEGLTPRRIARETNVSLRYLHLLFAKSGTTTAAWIRSRRIERCLQDLANAQLAHQSITQIAFKWGFNDLGHFGKLVRRQVGLSPREYRRRHLSCDTATAA